MCELRIASCELRIANWKSDIQIETRRVEIPHTKCRDPQIETRRVEIPHTKCRDPQAYTYHPMP